LLCDKDFKPAIAIELDGKSHRNAKRISRDGFVGRVYLKVGIRFERVGVGEKFEGVVGKLV
jgi:very-short-patch-repair endonuclease